MRIKRLLIFWTLFYVLGFMINFGASILVMIVPKTYIPVIAIMMIPLLTLLFGWLYFIKIDDHFLPQQLEVAGVWVGLAVVFDLITGFILYGMAVFYAFSSVTLVVYILSFGAIILAGYLSDKGPVLKNDIPLQKIPPISIEREQMPKI